MTVVYFNHILGSAVSNLLKVLADATRAGEVNAPSRAAINRGK